jgi:DNA-directed RNA polymerase subunit RPC12/RpoP
MALPSLTRQLLWERSGYKCVLCQKDVARSIHAFSGSRSFGSLCQIVSENRESPRYEWLREYDYYDNYILLCSKCRSEIEENWERHPSARLKTLRGVHEAEVRTAIAEEKRKKQEKEERLLNGTNLT